MPLVQITDTKFQHLITTEFSRVPCVGEKIVLDPGDGEGAPYGAGSSFTVQHVTWNVYTANDKQAVAMISIDFWDEDGKFASWVNSMIKKIIY